VTGKGYYFKIGEANRKRPQMYKDLGLDIKATNLCTEIMLHSSESMTYSCILSSMNVAKYSEWKDTEAVFEAMVFLDCLCSDFLEKSEGIPGLEKVRKFTEKGRATGLGVMGFSTYLQKKRIAFESLEAQFANNEIFKKIQADTLRASQWLAKELGESEWCRGYGVRNTHRTALAPTKSSSILMSGVSEMTSPDPGMVYEQSSAAGGMKRVNSELYEIMKERGVYNKKTLDNIINNLGSVQHVDWLTAEEKWVFKTAFEIDQNVILRYASQRQKYLCQGQSLNFFFAEDEKKISEIHTKAILDPNILSLYYIYSRSGAVVNGECLACSA
jgi:ribonucleoside-diphosphate reductase alpha chain